MPTASKTNLRTSVASLILSTVITSALLKPWGTKFSLKSIKESIVFFELGQWVLSRSETKLTI